MLLSTSKMINILINRKGPVIHMIDMINNLFTKYAISVLKNYAEWMMNR